MTLKEFFTQFFTWWNGQTLGTRFHTWRFGELVGTDEFGNRYYRRVGRPIDSNMGPERRWVIYNGLADLSRVPLGWCGWLWHTVDVPPSEETYVPREWEKPHIPNLTGKHSAYRPRGSILGPGVRPAADGEYVPRRPARRDRRLGAVAAGGIGRLQSGGPSASAVALPATTGTTSKAMRSDHS